METGEAGEGAGEWPLLLVSPSHPPVPSPLNLLLTRAHMLAHTHTLPSIPAS